MMIAVLQILVGLSLVLTVVLMKQLIELRATSRTERAATAARLALLELEMAEVRAVLELPSLEAAPRWAQADGRDHLLD